MLIYIDPLSKALRHDTAQRQQYYYPVNPAYTVYTIW